MSELAAVALIDLDNVDPPRPNRTAADVEDALGVIADVLCAYCLGRVIVPTELEMRFYGGWIDERGALTTRATEVQLQLPSIRGLRRGLRLRPTLATAVAAYPAYQLAGTLRRNGNKAWQKMVDTMLAVDAVHLADDGYSEILLVSDDDDLVPAVVSASSRRKRDGTIHLIRARAEGLGINDAVFKGCGGVIAVHGIAR